MHVCACEFMHVRTSSGKTHVHSNKYDVTIDDNLCKERE
jgi:hypothetical protein